MLVLVCFLLFLSGSGVFCVVFEWFLCVLCGLERSGWVLSTFERLG